MQITKIEYQIIILESSQTATLNISYQNNSRKWSDQERQTEKYRSENTIRRN
jgi:hypothetical protein